MNTSYFRIQRNLFLFAFIGFTFFSFSDTMSAKIGVGMGAGEIRLTEPVKLGGIYELPNIRIFNTGDEVTTYGMGVAFHQDYHQLRPAKEWFSFSPSTFIINPGESQEVKITMLVPLKGEPGDYFAFIESGPVPTNAPGTSVGVAVATKLFFTLVPANIFQAIGFRVSSFFETYSPWSWGGLGLVILIALFVIVRKFFSFNIAVRKQ
ncbi:MAG: hypothetical protein A3C70_01800 [Candidatus Zambryskibacteria bacterium RIFCSPHIGHO2_02_FULL_43_14]|uniref:Uncharacterized protein n=1 Tax=Candidatus Zambryskibacteria bacterium RIFCSPHIGHO2_02_FULL_43_14 TaxID=1802748 RepID=A0A1G2THE5_9BACT|nr:MAG: hypothetical protein A2829_01865 [Candidatus Zambryskibacteria bacterium RIFCSPHIGHO2_01_FULL_43_60]OHA96622.1 MAG: hypothetical protein A3C70_01800 [Candidatus Zambryskibacteria bacterium RIFCSPHIGHO2_02_FULL_43_14]OHB04036.1 MAG: hypothetical protein A3B03_01110 [Candidatus Zambryskibacteria bacterium RIFCSPLOWO2_01_FULL_42_41]